MPSLIDMPEVVMKNILENLRDFRDVQTLRKTCHDLRNLIDDSNYDPKIRQCAIWVDRSLSLGEERFGEVVMYYDHWNFGVVYKETKNGCLIAQNGKQKILKNKDFLKIAGNDIGLNLSMQKSKLELFEILNWSRTDPGFHETLWIPFLEHLSRNLKNRPRPLRVEEFKTCPLNQDEVLLILPFLDAKSIQKIHFYDSFYTDGRPENPLKIDEILKLEQWKMATIFTSDLFIDLEQLHGNYAHFEFVHVRVTEIAAEDLEKIRETFFNSTKLEFMKIRYHKLKDQPPFGEALLDERDWENCQTLRKTCHDLRNLIDDLKPDPKIKRVAIFLEETNKPGLIPGEIVIRYGEWMDIWVQYRQNQQGCLVDHAEKGEKLLENEDFLKSSVDDLRLILDGKKSKIEYFSIQIGCRDDPGFMEEIQMPFLKNLRSFLESRPRPLPVGELEICAISQEDVLQVLQFLDSKSISKIHFSHSWYGHKRPDEPLDISEMVHLEQWKSAKYFKSDLYLKFDQFHGNYAHFDFLWVRTKEITAEDLREVRETFLNSPNLQYFRVWYLNLKDPQPFGVPFTDENGDEHWYFRSSKIPEKILKITHSEDYSKMPTLLEMPDVVMSRILEVSSFRDVQALRKVCRDLRNFIDDTHQTGIIKSVKLHLTRAGITVDYGLEEGKIVYGGCLVGGCLVGVEDQKKNKFLQKIDISDACLNDLGLNLGGFSGPKNPILELFGIHSKCDNPQRISEFLKKFKNFLNSRQNSSQIQTKIFQMVVSEPDQILSIFPLLYREKLEEIRIFRDFFASESRFIDLEQIVKTEHWKRAKRVTVEQIFDTEKFLPEFGSFEEVKINFSKIGSANLEILKETFLQSTTLRDLQLSYFEINDFQNVLKDQNTYFRLPNCQEILRILHVSHSKFINFCRIPRDDVPLETRIFS
ncbi:unnamed protein product [Caenorhabditis brenneri]